LPKLRLDIYLPEEYTCEWLGSSHGASGANGLSSGHGVKAIGSPKRYRAFGETITNGVVVSL
jgi:hypothetical protein